MKRIAAILLASCLLAGCGAAGTMDDVAVLPAATAETAGQSLTVYCDARSRAPCARHCSNIPTPRA